MSRKTNNLKKRIRTLELQIARERRISGRCREERDRTITATKNLLSRGVPWLRNPIPEDGYERRTARWVAFHDGPMKTEFRIDDPDPQRIACVVDLDMAWLRRLAVGRSNCHVQDMAEVLTYRMREALVRFMLESQHSAFSGTPGIP